MQRFGQDDQWSWLLIPMLGFTIAACALMAIIYGLMTPEKWNARFNPQLEPDAAPGRTPSYGPPLENLHEMRDPLPPRRALSPTPAAGPDPAVVVSRP